MLAPWAVPGLGASVPARIVTPASCSLRTASPGMARVSSPTFGLGNAAFKARASAGER